MSKPPIAGPEDLTPHQRKYLRHLREVCNGRRPGALVITSALRLLVLLAVAIAVCAAFDAPELAIVLAAAVGGAASRDIAYLQASDRVLPALRAVIDRKRLEELTADPPHDSYHP